MTTDMQRLNALVHEQLVAEEEVAKAENALATAKKKLARLSEYVIPDVMEEMGINEYKTNDGLTIKLKQAIRASISEVNRSDAFGWMTDHDHEAMIKTSIVIEKPALLDDYDNAAELTAALSLITTSLPSTENKSIHPSTLSAFVRDKLEDGEEIPLDTFSVFRQVTSVVKTSK